MAELFTRDEIRAALEEVARILDQRRVRARIFVVGGAAIALAYYDRAATRDVDALFAPADLVAEAAEAVGRARGYPSGWLNDAVKTFMPVHGEQVHQPVLEVGSVSVSVAAPWGTLLSALGDGCCRRRGCGGQGAEAASSRGGRGAGA